MQYIIHYGELSLKGHNRGSFIRQLADNIELKTGGRVSRYMGRLYLEGGNGDELANIFGISWYAPCHKVESTPENIRNRLFEILDSLDTQNRTFGLFIKRSDKSFRTPSMQFARTLGKEISERYGMAVDLGAPDIPVHILIAEDTFIHFEKIKGAGGFPVGVTGKVISLLSGGIDSPVASYLLMKRGCDVDFVHFHAYPHNEQAFGSKIPDIVKILRKYQNRSRLYLVPYKLFQLAVFSNNIPAGYEMVLFRSFMFRFASALAEEKGYKAVVTGDSLSQVASQTIENLASAIPSCSFPLFQPLISFDKEEITDISKKIGTYDISIQQYKECCSILSRSPKTKTKPYKVRELEERMDFGELLTDTMDFIECYEI